MENNTKQVISIKPGVRRILSLLKAKLNISNYSDVIVELSKRVLSAEERKEYIDVL
jgi:hypothetical protein